MSIFTHPTHALARASRLAGRELRPLGEHSSMLLRRAAESIGMRFLGEDFDERLASIAALLPDGQRDAFGFDITTARYAAAVACLMHRVYFRTIVTGIDQVPAGRVLLIANHSGQLPIDGMLIGSAMIVDASPPRFIRSMVEKWTQTLPFVGTFFQRIGQVVGVPENCQRLLEAVVVHCSLCQLLPPPTMDEDTTG